MAAKRTLTDRLIKSLRATPGQRYEVGDSIVPGLAIRVTESGSRSFVLIARYPGSKNPTRRSLGLYGAITLVQAREKARQWLALIKAGTDPQSEIERVEEEARLADEMTFASLLEEFAKDKLKRERKGVEVEREIKRELIPRWGDRSVAEITAADVRTAIRSIRDRGRHAQARNMLGYAKRIFSWAVDEGKYGLDLNPCDRIKPANILEQRQSRTRKLDQDEIRAFLACVASMPYPAGPVYRLLMLTGLRLNEVADARWSEFDLKKGVWTIPGERMKLSKDRVLRPHAVPITDDIRAVLDGLPRPAKPKGDYVFSLSEGEKPIWITTKIKRRLDVAMLNVLRKSAEGRGEDPAEITVPEWINHDIRRTVRSGLAKLRIEEDIAEAVLAHTRPGIQKTYDLYDRLPEKRTALETWAAWLDGLENGPANNIVDFRAIQLSGA